MSDFALVGSLGAVTTGATGAAITPAWGAGSNRTAGNLLICWLAAFGHSGTITPPTGWSVAISVGQGSPAFDATHIFYKIATGGDATPTIAAVAGDIFSGQLGEFSGNGPINPLDRTGSVIIANGAASVTCTAGGIDTLEDQLVVYAASIAYAAAGTKVIGSSLNNGATDNNVNNGTTSTAQHYSFGWGITTGNSVADAESATFTATSNNGGNVVLASFRWTVPAAPSASVSSTSSAFTAITQVPLDASVPTSADSLQLILAQFVTLSAVGASSVTQQAVLNPLPVDAAGSLSTTSPLAMTVLDQILIDPINALSATGRHTSGIQMDESLTMNPFTAMQGPGVIGDLDLFAPELVDLISSASVGAVSFLVSASQRINPGVFASLSSTALSFYTVMQPILSPAVSVSADGLAVTAPIFIALGTSSGSGILQLALGAGAQVGPATTVSLSSAGLALQAPTIIVLDPTFSSSFSAGIITANDVLALGASSSFSFTNFPLPVSQPIIMPQFAAASGSMTRFWMYAPWRAPVRIVHGRSARNVRLIPVVPLGL